MMMVLCGMGVPMGLQYSITAIGSVILQTAANTLGSAAVAAMTAGGKIGNFLACPFDAMGSTMATYGGQNVGAGKLDRLGKGLKSCVLLGVGYSVIAFLIAVFSAVRWRSCSWTAARQRSSPTCVLSCYGIRHSTFRLHW